MQSDYGLIKQIKLTTKPKRNVCVSGHVDNKKGVESKLKIVTKNKQTK